MSVELPEQADSTLDTINAFPDISDEQKDKDIDALLEEIRRRALRGSTN